MINLIVTDENLRDKMIKKQNIRLNDFSYEKAMVRFKEQLNKVIHK